MRQKGPGSILSYLKRMNWALEIDVYTNENNYNTILEIEIRVTESGDGIVKHLSKPIYAIFLPTRHDL